MTGSTTYSESVTTASPAPFSPFSSSFSVSSEATFVSDDLADLGAFQSVFHALSQLQLHHNQQHGNPATTTSTPSGDGNVTPNVQPDPMSPLSLTSYQTSPPPTSAGFTSLSRLYDPSSATELASERSISTVERHRPISMSMASSISASVSSAAEDGDEESAGGTGSPQSSSDASVILNSFSRTQDAEGLIVSELVGGDPSPGVWMYSEISAHRPESSPDATSSSSPSATTSTFLLDGDEDGSPSLGDLGTAFAFFAAERAKLAQHIDGISASGGHHNRLTNKKAKKAKGPSLKKSKKASAKNGARARIVVQTINEDDILTSEDAIQTETGTSLSVEQRSSSDADNIQKHLVNQHRGLLAIPSKRTLFAYSKPSHLDSSSSLTPTVILSGSIPDGAADTRRKPTKHRHTRSLPSTSAPETQSTASTSGSQIARLRSLARRLTFHFPKNSPTLRRVIKDPASALGLGSHVGPSDTALVAGGFYDPVDDTIGSGVDRSSSSTNEKRDRSLLFVFIDHSNILIGFLEWLKRQNVSRPSKPRLSHAALVLLLERGRRCARKVLVASSPLYQSLDEIAGMAYQISVLQRVEIKEGASGASTPAANKANTPTHHRSSSFGVPGSSTVGGSTPGSPARPTKANKRSARLYNRDNATVVSIETIDVEGSTESDTMAGQIGTNPQTLIVGKPGPSGKRGHRQTSSADLTALRSVDQQSIPASRPRYREEAVDELLQLKLLQTLLDAPSPPPPGSTIILASGDAARSQFNPQGFLGCVRKALERGWKVEVVGWEEGRSRAWVDLKEEVDRVFAGGKGVTNPFAPGAALEIIGLDKWGMDLLENGV